MCRCTAMWPVKGCISGPAESTGHRDRQKALSSASKKQVPLTITDKILRVAEGDDGAFKSSEPRGATFRASSPIPNDLTRASVSCHMNISWDQVCNASPRPTSTLAVCRAWRSFCYAQGQQLGPPPPREIDNISAKRGAQKLSFREFGLERFTRSARVAIGKHNKKNDQGIGSPRNAHAHLLPATRRRKGRRRRSTTWA